MMIINIFRHYDFNLDKTIYLFTAGRYEFTNKGGDFFIEALARLNYRLKVCLLILIVIIFNDLFYYIFFPVVMRPNSLENILTFN